MSSLMGILNLRKYNNFTLKSRLTIPKLIKVFFFVLCFIFGMDFGFNKDLAKNMQNVTKITSTVISLIIMLILVAPLHKTGNADYAWYTIAFAEFICVFIILKQTKYTIYDFLFDLHNIDENITKLNKIKIGVLLWAYFFLWYFLKLCVDFYDCEIFFPGTCELVYFPYAIYNLICDGIDSMFMVPILIYCYFYYFLKDVNASFKKDSNISLLKKRYVAIADTYAKIRPFYEKLIILELLEIPKMMGLIYSMLKYIMDEEDLLASIGEYIYASNIISNMVCTGAMGQMVVFQVDALKIQLHSMILIEKDAEKSAEINRILGYIEARRLWRPVAGVIPVDMRLATTAFSLFATYMIVLVQLTHVVD